VLAEVSGYGTRELTEAPDRRAPSLGGVARGEARSWRGSRTSQSAPLRCAALERGGRLGTDPPRLRRVS
jgi:hypothetical protein